MTDDDTLLQIKVAMNVGVPVIAVVRTNLNPCGPKYVTNVGVEFPKPLRIQVSHDTMQEFVDWSGENGVKEIYWKIDQRGCVVL